RTVRLDTIDRRSQVGVALRRIREDLSGQLGDATPAERILVDEIAKARVIAAAVGDYILRQESLVREGELLPVVTQHAALVANLARMLSTLGLKRGGRSLDIVAALAEQANEPVTGFSSSFTASPSISASTSFSVMATRVPYVSSKSRRCFSTAVAAPF